MDFLTSAILAAVSVGVHNAPAGQIPSKLYAELKALLEQKDGQEHVWSQAFENLEREPESPIHQEILEKKVLAAKANEDAKIEQAAQALMAALKTQGVFSRGSNDSSIKVGNIERAAGVAIGKHSKVDSRITEQSAGDHSNQIVSGRDTHLHIYGESSTSLPATAPSPAPYFVGRKQIRLKIKKLITKTHLPASVIALIGMGGIGKTTLARQIAEDVKQDFPGGIFWGRELPAQDANPAIILREWGSLCGQNLENEKDANLPSTLRGLLAKKQAQEGRILAIIDDARLDWTAGGLGMIKEALPSEVPLLVTTRQAQTALKVGGTKFDLDVLSRAESCRMLTYLSEGKITSSNARTISELCGDMPLALFLIAGLSRIRALDWLMERLQVEAKRLDILKLDPADRKEESVKLSFDVSYQALAEQYPEAARIFRSLSVFAQPIFLIFEHFTNTLAQVGKQRPADPGSEKEHLKNAEEQFLRLVDWSLLTEEKNMKGGEMQYFAMHTLLHEYAQSLPVDKNEHNDAVDNHIHYCASFAKANPQLDLQIYQPSTQVFEKSYGQLLQALKQIKELHLPKVNDWENAPLLAHQVIALVDVLDHHWQLHSRFADQVEWLPVAYDCAGGMNNSINQADFARRLGRVLRKQGHLDDAIVWMERCQTALGENESAEANIIRAVMCIDNAVIQHQQGNLDMAEKECQRGISLGYHLASTRNQLRSYAEGYNVLGAIRYENGNFATALEAYQKSLSLWEQAGDQYWIASVNENIGSIHYNQGHFALARDAGERHLVYWKKFPDRIELAVALTNQGLVYERLGDNVLALDFQKQAIEISDRIGIPRMQALAKNNIAGPCIALKEYAEAEKYLNESLQIQSDHKLNEYQIATQCYLAELECSRQQYRQAIKRAKQAVKLARKGNNPFDQGEALRVLGQAHYATGKLEEARNSLETSRSLLRANEYKYEDYLTSQVLEKVYADLGDAQEARAAAEEVRTLAEEMGLLPAEDAP